MFTVAPTGFRTKHITLVFANFSGKQALYNDIQYIIIIINYLKYVCSYIDPDGIYSPLDYSYDTLHLLPNKRVQSNSVSIHLGRLSYSINAKNGCIQDSTIARNLVRFRMLICDLEQCRVNELIQCSTPQHMIPTQVLSIHTSNLYWNCVQNQIYIAQ